LDNSLDINELPRIPESVGGIQVNHCKNPLCLNYGRAADYYRQPRGRGAKNLTNRDTYTISGSGSRTERVQHLKCGRCGELPTIKSNLGIYEEYQRLSAYLKPPAEQTCPSESCGNKSVGISNKDGYWRYGKNRAGTQRYKCKSCGRIFSVSDSPLHYQKVTHKNINLFRLLVNKVPFTRICEVADIGAGTLYRKIDFIHRQCLAFVSERERLIPELDIPRLYLAVDRQEYTVNWTNTRDKRNVILSALGTADNRTSYVFGMHLNYDPSLTVSDVIADAFEHEDYLKPAAFRRHARLWLPDEFEQAVDKATSRSMPMAGFLFDEITSRYEDVLLRDDVEVFEAPDLTVRLPENGLQVHAEYTLYGHFFFLKELFRNVGKVRFYLDQESGIRAACLSAFVDEVLQKRCDAFYVRISKDLTVHEKQNRIAACKRELEEYRDQFAMDADIVLEVIKRRMKDMRVVGAWKDKWLTHPLPNMSEPDKAVCWLTDLHDRSYDDDHIAQLYKKASLHGIDRFFMQVRRKLSLLERPISSASNTGRRWHGYSAYNPVNVIKMLEIFRVFYNYVQVGDDKETPAMRLGLARGPVSLKDILYFSEGKTVRYPS
jgi:transposase-like protein